MNCGGRNDGTASGVSNVHSLLCLACSREAGARPRTLEPAVAIESAIDLAAFSLQPSQRFFSAPQTQPLRLKWQSRGPHSLRRTWSNLLRLAGLRPLRSKRVGTGE